MHVCLTQSGNPTRRPESLVEAHKNNSLIKEMETRCADKD
jgi:hypothetical protein